MSFEFVHTSVERGLRGESGFTVATVTRGLPAGLEPSLAELSAYDFDANRAVGADRIDWAHRILSIQGKSYTVLSRTAPCGNDWSGRPNRIAHHLIVDANDRAVGGPAWMLAQFKGFHSVAPTVEERAVGPSLPKGAEPVRPADAWRAAGFDPGWAGMIAQTLLEAPQTTCCVVLPDGVDGLPLVLDVLALLPEEKRWFVTFSTRFQRLPAGGRCQLRLLRAGAIGVRAMLAEPGTRAIEVKPGVSAGEGDAAKAAREGRQVRLNAAGASPSGMEPTPRPVVKPQITAWPATQRTVSMPSSTPADVAWEEASIERSRSTEERPYELVEEDPARVQRFRSSPAPKALPDPLVLALFAYSAIVLAIAFGLFFA
jgi:hypothetical protein